jgi:hypothetical protein
MIKGSGVAAASKPSIECRRGPAARYRTIEASIEASVKGSIEANIESRQASD